jgi:hypothetical protein
VTPDEVAAKLATHEAVCSQRYGNVIDRLANIEKLVGWGVRSVMGGLLIIIGFLLVHYVLVK